MTYFGFLLRFLAIPIVLLGIIAFLDYRRGRRIPPNFRGWPFWAAVALHVIVAVVYTTPWDNYLVATGVWYYNPALVIGIVIGWVPIEEYTFFVVETILAGLWIAFLMRRMRFDQLPPLRPRWRSAPAVVLGLLWIGSVAMLVSGWPPGTYLSLLLAWALPPILLQFGFGGDILRRYGRLVFVAIVTLTLYLSAADFLAIGSGTWEIDPAQSLHWLIGGVLPVEEVIFFLITSMLVTLGVVLILAVESHERFAQIRTAIARRRKSPQPDHA
jgi:lycopene cyclase domain-containing protein